VFVIDLTVSPRFHVRRIRFSSPHQQEDKFQSAVNQMHTIFITAYAHNPRLNFEVFLHKADSVHNDWLGGKLAGFLTFLCKTDASAFVGMRQNYTGKSISVTPMKSGTTTSKTFSHRKAKLDPPHSQARLLVQTAQQRSTPQTQTSLSRTRMHSWRA
jgi:hypothetical protein